MFKKKKLRKFLLTGIVDRSVLDTIDLTVEAVDESEAYAIARRVLDKFPEAHNEEGVLFCFIRSREYGRPELYSLLETEDEGARA